MLRNIALALVLVASTAHAQPDPDVSVLLRDADEAAIAGDWTRLARAVAPLEHRALELADLAEAHRLAGIAAFFTHHPAASESHFLSYLLIEPDGRIDPALYPPDVLAFFNDVASRHAAELRAQRLRPRRSWWLTLIPPLGQWQNGDHTKVYVLGSMLGVLLAVNLGTYTLLREWCEHTDGPAGGGLNCDDGKNRNHEAAAIQPYNIASGIGFALVYLYGVYDGVRGYRQRSRELSLQPFVTASAEQQIFGLAGRF
jgi:hypothetical protein